MERRANLVAKTAGWCLVLFYLCVSSSFSLPVTAALGALGQGHQVLPGMATDGAPVVVLHHRVLWPEHQHGILARTLAVFAERNDTPGADHILELPAGVHCVPAEDRESHSFAVAMMTIASEPGGKAVRANSPAARVGQWPPVEGGLLRFLRSAQLLI